MTTWKRSNTRKQIATLAGGPLTLAMLVRAIREGEQWSLVDMAERLGVTRAQIAAVEHGKAVSAARAAHYARALGYSEPQFVRLALQDEIERAGLRYRVGARTA